MTATLVYKRRKAQGVCACCGSQFTTYEITKSLCICVSCRVRSNEARIEDKKRFDKQFRMRGVVLPVKSKNNPMEDL